METLSEFKHSSGFSNHQRPNHYSPTQERFDIFVMRDNYLEWDTTLPGSGIRNISAGGTWEFLNMSQPRIRQPKNFLCADDIDYSVSSGNRDSSIFCHLGSAETVFFEDSMLLFTCRKSSTETIIQK